MDSAVEFLIIHIYYPSLCLSGNHKDDLTNSSMAFHLVNFELWNAVITEFEADRGQTNGQMDRRCAVHKAAYHRRPHKIKLISDSTNRWATDGWWITVPLGKIWTIGWTEIGSARQRLCVCWRRWTEWVVSTGWTLSGASQVRDAVLAEAQAFLLSRWVLTVSIARSSWSFCFTVVL